MTKKIFLPITIIALIGAIMLITNDTYAQNQGENNQTIIQKLAQKFGLKEDDVKAVFNEERQERQKEMQTKFEDRLNQAVTNGKLTEEQKQLILTKHQELLAKKDENQSNRQTQKQELEDWAKQNNIDLQYFFGGFGKHGMRMKGVRLK